MTDSYKSDQLVASYALCKQINRAHGKTYFWATATLAPESRKHVHAIYAFCRHADDIIDCLPQNETERRKQELQAFADKFFADLKAGTSSDELLAAVVNTTLELQIDPGCFERFIRAMSLDLTTSSYKTYEDLLVYMDGSAAVIGEMMLPVLAPDTSPASGLTPNPKYNATMFEAARNLGIAFQLTNFIRDVNEDLNRGRVYIPRSTLQQFGADPRRRTVDAPWRAAMKFEISRARNIYAGTDMGIAMLPKQTRTCVQVARDLYSAILDQVEAHDYDVFSHRARVSTWKKIRAAALAWQSPSNPLGRRSFVRR